MKRILIALILMLLSLGAWAQYADTGTVTRTGTRIKVDGVKADYYFSIAPANYGEWTVTAVLGADTADLALCLQGREEAVRACQLPLGIHNLLLPELLPDTEPPFPLEPPELPAALPSGL